MPTIVFVLATAATAQPQEAQSLPAANVQAQPSIAPDASQSSPRHLLPLPAEEDWRFLADPKQRTDPFDGVKYIPFGTRGPDSGFASLGAEVRYFYEAFNNEGFGQIPGATSYLEQRYVLHADIQPNANARLFVSLQSSLIGGRPGGPRPTVDEDTFDVLEGFAEYHSAALDRALLGPNLAVRLGRQQLDFGAGRLVSSREGLYGEGPNVLQPFDGVRAIERQGPWRLDLFAARPVQNNVGALDDGPAPGLALWGAYLTRGGAPGAPVPGLDLYYFGTTRPNAAFFGGGFDADHKPTILTATEHRHIAGVRFSKSGAPSDYDAEAFYQFGTFGARNIAAWGIAAQGGHTVQSWPWSPRFGLRAGINSGGSDPTTLQTSYVPYPRGVYFGNLSALGPENTGGVEPAIDLHPTPAFTATASAFFFWRQNANDGIYALAGYPLIPPLNGQHYVGYQRAFTANWQANPHLSLNAAYETFALGDFLSAVPGTRAIDYIGAWTTFRF